MIVLCGSAIWVLPQLELPTPRGEQPGTQVTDQTGYMGDTR